MTYEEELAQLEEDENTLTEEAITAMLLLLGVTQSNLENAIREFYQKYGKDGVVTYQEARKWVDEKDHRRRLTVLLLLLSDTFDSLHSKLNPKFDSFLTKIVNKELSFFDVELDVEDILNTPWGIDDAVWYSRLSDDIDLWKAYVGSDLKRSFLKQEHLDSVLQRLDKRFVSMSRALQNLGITESTAIGSLTRRQIFKELGIKKYRFYAREDERTCEQCGSLHGLIFPISAYSVGETASPIHPRCRCWEVPIWD